MTQPAHATATISPEQTVDGELRASRLPEAVVSGAMRRLASPQGLLARRTASRRGPSARADRSADGRRSHGQRAAGRGPDRHGDERHRDRRAAPGDCAAAGAVGAIDAAAAARAPAPETTVLERTKARVGAPPGTWTRPDPLAPVATGLQFPEPMYDGLQQVAPWLLLPGLERVEADSVALLETTPRVIEAYMAGLNHELSRELLWREFPADLTGTPFRQFWDVRGQAGDPRRLKDIPPLAEWGKTALGTHLRGGRRRPTRAARPRRAAAPLPDDDDLRRRSERGRHARRRRRGWRRCSAASSRRTWCSSASR